MHPRGLFITFEGLDGCGKSTQLKKLAEVLRRDGHEVVVTREPGGTTIGEKVRAILLNSRTTGMAPLTELALMFAARAQQVHEIIRPAVNAGKIVLCDRFTDSSEAYQGGGRELGSETVLKMHELACGGLQPDLTILMLSDPGASVARARGRNERAQTETADEGRFEMEDHAFYDRVLKTYQAIAAREPRRVAVIDSSRSIEEVHADILRAVHKSLKVPVPAQRG